jgi:competence protein ComFC
MFISNAKTFRPNGGDKSMYLKIINFVLPLRCSFCNGSDILSAKVSVCKKCYASQREKISLRCQVCKSLLSGGICEFCTSRNVFFERMEYIYIREPFQSELINKMKFQDEPFLGNYFRIGFKKKWKKFHFPNFSFITFIPSNQSTMKKRPIHPLSQLLPLVSQLSGSVVLNTLSKVSKQKQGDQSYRQRFIHARYSMEILKESKDTISGNVLLVDDIFTTGATMNEASRILLENGAEKVYLLTLLRGD